MGKDKQYISKSKEGNMDQGTTTLIKQEMVTSSIEFNQVAKPQFLISVDRSRMNAHMMMRDIDNKKLVTREEILEGLKRKGIIFGIDEKAIEKGIRDNEYFLDVIVAKGKSEVCGKDAEFKTEISIRESSREIFEAAKKQTGKKKTSAGTRVKRDEVLMTRVPATTGIDGKNIYGMILPAERGRNKEFPMGENVYETPDGLELRATVEGIACSVDGVINVLEIKKEEVAILISKDEMTAFITIKPGDSEKVEIGIEEIKEMLKSAGVKYGIRNSFERLIPKKLAEEVSIEIASGLSPINGKNGFMKVVSQDMNNNGTIYKTDESGNVDFREKLNTDVIKMGDIVAILSPPTGGRDGITVTGNQIQAVPGKPGKIIAGKNVRLNETSDKVIAEADGKLVVNGSTIHVDNVMNIESNIDYSTGNITFDGAVYVKGDILTDFYISASGDIFVNGVVDGGSVTSGANVTIKGAIYGGNKSRIKAQGNVVLRSADQAIIEAGENVIVEHFMRNCRVKAGDNLKVLHPGKGHILGGRITVGGMVETLDLGSITFTPTLVELGASPEVLGTFSCCSEEIAQTKMQMEKIEPGLRSLNKLRKDGTQLSPDKALLLNNLYMAYMSLQSKLVQIEEERNRLEDRMKLSKRGVVTAMGTVFPGVRIRIGVNVLNIKNELNRVSISGALHDSEEFNIKNF